MALIVLSIGAVAFLLRVLAALVKEGVRLPQPRARARFAKFNSTNAGAPRQPAEIIEMSPQPQQSKASARSGERIAL